MSFFARSKRGQGLAEYGMIIVLVALVCVVILTSTGKTVDNNLGASSKKINEATVKVLPPSSPPAPPEPEPTPP